MAYVSEASCTVVGPRPRAELLDRAKEIVTKERQSEHGAPEDNFVRIASMWQAYLGVPVLPHDVANLMILLKVARSRSNSQNKDNWVDVAGYAACASEVASKELPPPDVRDCR